MDKPAPSAAGVDDAVRCVFSSAERIKVGTGMTTRTHSSRLLWFVEGLGEGRFSLRKINDHHVPTGEEKVIGRDKLLRDFAPEVEYFEQYTLPAMELLEDYLDEGEAQREEGRLYSAEGSFNKALGLDEGNVRALFNLGLIYMEMEDEGKTHALMRSLLAIRSAFSGKDQHLFNEFGISLRKHGLFGEAVEYYSRALDFAPGDDHLHFNLSRAHFERGDWEGCVASLARSRELNPELEPAAELGSLVVRMAADPELCRRRGKPPVPDVVARAVEDLMVPPLAADIAPPEEVPAPVRPPEPGHARSMPEPEPEPEGAPDRGAKPVRPRPELARGNGYTRAVPKKKR